MLKKCFIENDFEIDDFDAEYFKEKTGKNHKRIFNKIITEAHEKPKEVFKAIQKHDEIWVSTSFVGESGDMLTAMLKLTIDGNIKNKTIVNLREYKDVAWHLTEEQITMIRKVQSKNKIKFIFRDDYKKYNRLSKAL